VTSRDQVRLANHWDETMADRIWSAFQISYRIEAALLGVDSFPPLERSRESIQKSNSYYWCHENLSRLAGVLEVEETPSCFGICSLAVVPDFFRQGIASKLVSHVVLAANGKRVVVQTAKLNVPAISLYKKLGFTEKRSWSSAENIELVSLEWSVAH
jgi:ribosomal protein S18 acetylase RimI-like enzyme